MAATSEFTETGTPANPATAQDRAVAFRLIATLFGSALVVAGLGMWLVPGSSWSAELLLIKLGLTSVFLLSGLCFIQAARHRR